MTRKYVKLTTKIKGKFVCVEGDCLRFSNTKPMSVKEFFAQHVGPNKGLRRALRKELDSVGRHGLSHASVHS